MPVYARAHTDKATAVMSDCSLSAVLLLCFLCLSEIKPVNVLVFQLQPHSAFSPLPLVFVPFRLKLGHFPTHSSY